MKTAILIAIAAALSGCTTTAKHNADLKAGRAAAEEGRRAAAAAMEAVRGITPKH